MVSIKRKARILKDHHTVNGTLYKGDVVKVDTKLFSENETVRVIDNVGRIWHINSQDIKILSVKT